MFTLKIENVIGQAITLTQNESNYQILEIEGLNPPKANIFTNPVANMDGEKFKSSKLEMRNIVLTIKINGNAEENRLTLYSYLKTGKYSKIYYKNDSRNVFVEGYCETIECPLFTINQQMQISIICPDPYLQAVETIYNDISKELAAFIFPFAIEEEGIPFSDLNKNRISQIMNLGEVETGMVITLIAKENNIVNPTVYNSDTGEYMRIETILNLGDQVVINTNKSKKSIVKISGGETTNIINFLSGSSNWLQLEAGLNSFTYDADLNDDKLKVTFEFNLRYEGV